MVQPVKYQADLYEISVGTQVWRYNSRSKPITYNGNVFLPYPIERGSVAASPEEARNSLSIISSSEFPPAQMFSQSPPTTSVIVNLFNWAILEDGTESVSLLWSGRAMACSWKDEADEVEIQCEPLNISLGRNALYRRYSKNCPYALYDQDSCKVSKAAYKYTTTVSAIDGLSVTLAGVNPAHNYAGGFMEWNAGTHVETRFIEFAVQGNPIITLMTPGGSLSVGQSVDIYPGCDRTPTTCNTVFSNILNFGGWPYMKATNPFDTRIGFSSNTNDVVSSVGDITIPLVF